MKKGEPKKRPASKAQQFEEFLRIQKAGKLPVTEREVYEKMLTSRVEVLMRELGPLRERDQFEQILSVVGELNEKIEELKNVVRESKDSLPNDSKQLLEELRLLWNAEHSPLKRKKPWWKFWGNNPTIEHTPEIPTCERTCRTLDAAKGWRRDYKK